MKRYLFLSILFVLVLSLLRGDSLDAAGKTGIEVYNYDGMVTYLRSRVTEPVDLDMSCEQDDVFKTAEDGELDLTMHGTVGVRMFSSGECVLEKTKRRSMHLKLNKGSMLAKVKPPSGGSVLFKLETPASVVEAREALFSVDIDESQPGSGSVAKFTVGRGNISVFVTATRSTIPLREGQTVEIPAEGSSAVPIRFATEEELDRANSANAIVIAPR